MINKKLSTFLFLILLVSIVSATTLQTYKSQRVDEEFNFTQTCNDATYMTLSTIITPNSTESLNINMTATGGGSYSYNYTPNQIGQYDFNGISDGCLKTFAVFVDVTADGKTYDTGDSLIRIFVAIFFILMMLGFHRVAKDINYEKWYDKIQKKYITRNFVKYALSAIVYSIMKESMIVYFLLGLPIMLMLTDLIFIYNITSITLYIYSLLFIYITLIIVLGIAFLSHIQEWFIDSIEQLKNNDWGME